MDHTHEEALYPTCFPDCPGLDDPPEVVSGKTNDLCFQRAQENGIVFRYAGKVWLYISMEEGQNFDITGWPLRPCQLNLGLGREYFPALLEPAFVPLSEHVEDYHADEDIILIETNEGSRIYPLDLVNNHVVVNDVVDGTPVMISYTVLSDNPAVFRRVYCDTLFTFAVTGYSYWDYDVLNATNDFLLYDRETESLWWPLTRRGVSGMMKDIQMDLYDETRWRITTWQTYSTSTPRPMRLST